MLRDALLLQLGYNAALVSVGAAALGVAAGAVGAFLYLRRRALVSDAISHATLPGVALAFLFMVALGGDGRWLAGLLAGAALSAAAGLWVTGWLTRATRLSEDAAIGAVLSVFFGAGVVLLTVIQSVPAGRQAGLEDFLLGSTAGMLRADALLIAAGGLLVLAAAGALSRPLLIAAFDPGFAAVQGIDTRRLDAALMALVLAVTVVGLKVVGLILIVALLIIPAVAARFWSDHGPRVVVLSGLLGGLSGWLGAALSASAPNLPTGALVVLSAAAIFAVSLSAAPARGLLAQALRHRRLQHRVHLRQGLMALARGEPVYEARTRSMLRSARLMRPDGQPTEAGRAQAAATLRDEARWRRLRRDPALADLAARDDGLTLIDTVLTPDQVAALDAALQPRPA